MRSAGETFWSEESGQGLIEYALIVTLFSIGLIAILLVLRATCSTTPQVG